jgi:nitroreductase
MTQAEVLSSILASRHSCRGFLDKAVPQEVLSEVLADAQNVPSWCNSQPWQVLAFGSQETRALTEALYEHSGVAGHESDIPFPMKYEGAYQTRRRKCGWQLYEAVGVPKGDRAASAQQMRENFRLFGASNFLLITTPKALGSYGALDCGAFVTAVLLGLQARGLGGIAMASVAGYAPFWRARYDIAVERDILCGIALGYPDPDHPANGFRTGRASEKEVVTWI